MLDDEPLTPRAYFHSGIAYFDRAPNQVVASNGRCPFEVRSSAFSDQNLNGSDPRIGSRSAFMLSR
jgi:hypothetical protein